MNKLRSLTKYVAMASLSLLLIILNEKLLAKDIYKNNIDYNLDIEIDPFQDVRISAENYNKSDLFPLMYAAFPRLKIWVPGSTIRVCFYGGSQERNQIISKVANVWIKKTSANLKIEFNNNPDSCKHNPLNYDIRVGYRCSGYWSLIGSESHDLELFAHSPPCSEDYQTLNLSGYDNKVIGTLRAHAVILHEFGHALGLKHEHQNPEGSCTDDILWDVLYEELGAEPLKWPKERVDRNFRALDKNSDAYFGTEFDPDSIMMYQIPIQYLRKKSNCITSKTNSSLSHLDIVGFSSVYSVDRGEFISERQKIIRDLRVGLLKNDGGRIAKNKKFEAINKNGVYDLNGDAIPLESIAKIEAFLKRREHKQ